MSVAIGPNQELESLSEEKRAIEEQQKKLMELQGLEGRLATIKDRISRLEKERTETKAESERCNAEEHPRLLKALADIEGDLKKLNDERLELEASIKSIRDELPAASKIDKWQILRNIRTLMKVKDGKVGQVEKESGNSAGYMSRLERDGNTTTPTLEFVATAAEMLGVNMELIIRGNIEEISSTDMYMLEFLSELITQTDAGDTVWQQEDLDFSDGVFVTDDYMEPKDEMSSPRLIGRSYKSAFHLGDVQVAYDALALSATLAGSQSRLYIIPTMAEFEPGPVTFFEDVYLAEPLGNP